MGNEGWEERREETHLTWCLFFYSGEVFPFFLSRFIIIFFFFFLKVKSLSKNKTKTKTKIFFFLKVQTTMSRERNRAPDDRFFQVCGAQCNWSFLIFGECCLCVRCIIRIWSRERWPSGWDSACKHKVPRSSRGGYHVRGELLTCNVPHLLALLGW